MHVNKLAFRSILVIGLACCGLVPVVHTRAAGEASAAQLPAIIQNGFKAWGKNHVASWAFDVWKIGGLMEQDKKPGILSQYLIGLDPILGNYQSYDVIDSKHISQNSSIIYLAVNFTHAAMFARFMMYRTDKDWVVQNVDFSAKPEAVMQWLAFEGGNYSQ